MTCKSVENKTVYLGCPSAGVITAKRSCQSNWTRIGKAPGSTVGQEGRKKVHQSKPAVEKL
jgi:hypothetical protein